MMFVLGYILGGVCGMVFMRAICARDHISERDEVVKCSAPMDPPPPKPSR